MMFLNLTIGEIYWEKEDKEYMADCFLEGSASSYNAGSERLAILQTAIEDGVALIVDKNKITKSKEFERWIEENYPSFMNLVRKRNYIKINE